MATIAIDATYTVDPQPSGVATYSRRLIESLAGLESRHRFLICYRWSRFGRRRDFLRIAGRTPGGPAFFTRLYQQPLTFWLPWQADLFHSVAQRPPAFRFAHEVVTVHDVFPLAGQDYATPGFREKFSRLLLEAVGRAALIITPSAYTSRELARQARVGVERVRVIPEGVDLPAYEVPVEERDRQRQQLVGHGNVMILSVGIIQARKNTMNAVRALEHLPARYRLVLAGGDGYGSEAIHEFIRREAAGSRVTVLGHVPREELLRLYGAATVFLFPSLEEGFGLPVLEAMAHGVPVVASNVSSLPEVGGDAALYADPHDPRQIAAQVERAVEDAIWREKMIAGGLRRARQFSWRLTAEKTLAVYDEVLAARPA
ncbi:MAG TPA: glycosyltransferase family 1 protein [Terriglobia bacterium]|nr:glycosyltransferase family 1 protein [Terriglobia bacterium]